MSMIFPEGYKALLGLKTTQRAIKSIKTIFEDRLSSALNLTRVSAPLFVEASSGLNDNLNGTERPVRFDIAESGSEVEIVHSLAKWKRYALARYKFPVGEGLYTDMNAVRRDEITDNFHSTYVDQWDWEKIITADDRNMDTLRGIVRKIYGALKETEAAICEAYPILKPVLPEDIFFISSFDLEKMYPELTPKERENAVCKQHGAVFISQIGCKLASGERHDGRAPDYDDWSLNGDILLWYDVLDSAIEISSMGIRVDKDSLVSQLKEAGCEERLELPFQSALMKDQLPLTVGGGIGQSRVCMFLLKKAHIGEVQVCVWPQKEIDDCREHGIELL